MSLSDRLLKTDPFEPGSRHEEVQGARFWPDTLFVDLSAYPDEVQSYDHRELTFWDDCDLGILVAMAARMHEQLHWLQTIGTTFGRFLATNRVTTGGSRGRNIDHRHSPRAGHAHRRKAALDPTCLA